MKKLLMSLLLIVLMLSVTGCDAKVGKTDIATTLWYIAEDVIANFIFRETGISFEDRDNVINWSKDRLHKYDPDGNLTKYINMDILLNDVYNSVEDALENVVNWSPGADPDIYTVLEHDRLQPKDVWKRLENQDIFK